MPYWTAAPGAPLLPLVAAESQIGVYGRWGAERAGFLPADMQIATNDSSCLVVAL